MKTKPRIPTLCVAPVELRIAEPSLVISSLCIFFELEKPFRMSFNDTSAFHGRLLERSTSPSQMTPPSLQSKHRAAPITPTPAVAITATPGLFADDPSPLET